ncbi:MAG: hypothetical protein ACYCU8_11935, partial [Ferrimicrobium acidiphilum]
MKPSWFSSDLHFGHENIISFCKRPFSNTTEMNLTIIRTWNEMIEPDAVVWVLGDIALGSIKDTLPLVGSLNGRLVQIPGNHDRNWRGHGSRAGQPLCPEGQSLSRDYLVAGSVWLGLV